MITHAHKCPFCRNYVFFDRKYDFKWLDNFKFKIFPEHKMIWRKTEIWLESVQIFAFAAFYSKFQCFFKSLLLSNPKKCGGNTFNPSIQRPSYSLFWKILWSTHLFSVPFRRTSSSQLMSLYSDRWPFRRSKLSFADVNYYMSSNCCRLRKKHVLAGKDLASAVWSFVELPSSLRTRSLMILLFVLESLIFRCSIVLFAEVELHLNPALSKKRKDWSRRKMIEWNVLLKKQRLKKRGNSEWRMAFWVVLMVELWLLLPRNPFTEIEWLLRCAGTWVLMAFWSCFFVWVGWLPFFVCSLLFRW